MSGSPTSTPDSDQPEFYSCFISYAHLDNAFAEKLHDDLEAHGVSCWKDNHDIQSGKFYRPQIVKAIRENAKLILICSEISVGRAAVVEEIIAAMNRERETHKQKLFPLRLDDFILGTEMLTLADNKMDAGEWSEDWVRYVRAYHIPDFSHWEDEAAYQKEFAKLLRDLQQPPMRQ